VMRATPLPYTVAASRQTTFSAPNTDLSDAGS
jgi:hypothetical protein